MFLVGRYTVSVYRTGAQAKEVYGGLSVVALKLTVSERVKKHQHITIKKEIYAQRQRITISRINNHSKMYMHILPS